MRQPILNNIDVETAERLELRAKRLGMTPEEMVSVWALAEARALAEAVVRAEAEAPAVRMDRSKIHPPAIAKPRELRQVKPRTLPCPCSALHSS